MKNKLISVFFCVIFVIMCAALSVSAVTLDGEKGVQIYLADFTAKDGFKVTSYNSDYMTGATVSVEGADYYNVVSYGDGYITMGKSGSTVGETRVIVGFGAEGEGMAAKSGRYTTEYDVAAAKGSSTETCTSFIDRIYSDGEAIDLDNGDALANIIAVADNWYRNVVEWEAPSDAEVINSYNMLLTSSGNQYYDNIAVWLYPANSFMVSEGGELSLVTSDSDTYTFPDEEGKVWKYNLTEYKPGETVDISDIEYKTLTAETVQILDENKGERLVLADFKSKTWSVADFNEEYMDSASVSGAQAHKECFVSASGDGYIVMSRDDVSHTRVIIGFNDGAGMESRAGKYTTEYDVAIAKGSSSDTVGEFRDRIFYNGSDVSTDTYKDFVHSDVCEELIAMADAWVHEAVEWSVPGDATVINSYNMYLKSSGRQYYDNIEIWYFPENSFMLNVDGDLSLIETSGGTYEFPEAEGFSAWLVNNITYKPGDTVNVSDIQYKSVKAVNEEYVLDESLVTVGYSFENTRAGSADGTVKIDFGSQKAECANKIELYWGNGDEVLSDFTVLKTSDGVEMAAGYTFDKALAMPKEATTLIARITDSVKTFDVVYQIPESKLVSEEPLYTVAFASDIHVGYGGIALRETQLKAREEINSLADFLVVVGDFTQWYGQITEDKIGEWALAEEYFKGYNIPVYFAKGNHDEPNYNDSYVASVGYENFSYEHFDKFLDMWLAYSAEKGDYAAQRIDSTTDYYDTEINGHHYIFLAVPNEGYYRFEEKQLKWLDETLYEKEESGKPIFVMGHVPVGSKVSHPSTTWNDGPEDDEALIAILEKHPNAIYISGDTHYTLDTDYHNTVNGEQKSPSYFNDGAVIDAWIADDESDPNNPTWHAVPGTNAMGIIAEVYSDRILLKGRHFVNGKWIARGFSEITFMEECPLNEIAVTKYDTDGGKTVLTVKEADESLTYTWYAFNGQVLGTGSSVTVDTSFEGFVAVRAQDSDGNYRSESFGSLAEVPYEIDTYENTELRVIDGSPEKTGIRFKAAIAPSLKSSTGEYGFIVSRNEILDGDELTFDLDSTKYVYGAAYETDESGNVTKDIVNSTDENGRVIFACVCVGMETENADHVTAELIVRPYYKLNVGDGTVIAYGRSESASMKSTAEAIRSAGGTDYTDNKMLIDSLADME